MLKLKSTTMLKRITLLLVIMLAVTGCAAGKTDEELIAEGWVKNPQEQGWVQESEIEDTEDNVEETAKELPAPLIDANDEQPYAATNSSINVDNLDEYLNRDDVVYIDIRDYNAYAQKHFKNFEVVPYFGFIFNAEAHTDANMVQLYGGSSEEPIDVYEQSDALLNAIFPKDKTLFIMCEAGGRVTQMMQILDAKGYDMTKVYNVGGVGQYTDPKYKEHLTDTLEFIVDANYSMEGMTRK